MMDKGKFLTSFWLCIGAVVIPAILFFARSRFIRLYRASDSKSWILNFWRRLAEARGDKFAEWVLVWFCLAASLLLSFAAIFFLLLYQK